MQTIENSLLQVSVDENGAQLVQLISEPDNIDYLKNGEEQGKAVISFPEVGEENDLAKKLPWTVVDKGDARVSLTLIDSAESYKKFPYHFEVMATYAIEGPQLTVSFYVKNNSNKEMPFLLKFHLPIKASVSEESINKILLTNAKKDLLIQSTDLNLKVDSSGIISSTEKLGLIGKSDQIFKLNFTIQ